MMEKVMPRESGPLFWITAARHYGLEHWLYLGHRLSGLGMLAYFCLHLWVTAARLGGEAAWEARMALFDNALFHAFEYVVFVACLFHGANGLRLILAELGFGLGKPGRPVYPYRTCLERQRRLALVLVVVALALAGLGALDLGLGR